MFQRVPAEQYFELKRMSSSALKEIAQRSPRHYYAKYELGKRADATPEQEFGTLVHTCLLESETFLNNYRVKPKFDRRTTKGKEAEQLWLSDVPPDCVVVEEGRHEELLGMVESLRSHKLAMELLKDGMPEATGLFTEPTTKVECKARLDFLRNDAMIVDIKTTKDARASKFSRDIWEYGYHIQAAFYCLAASEILGRTIDTFAWIAMEKTPPYEIVVWTASLALLDKGKEQYEEALKVYKACKEREVALVSQGLPAAGAWPGYATEATDIDLPVWAYT